MGATFVSAMREHLEEEERVIPGLLLAANFTQEEEQAVVGKIIKGLGLDGNRKALPPMLYAFALWAGEEKAEEFVKERLPFPIQLLYRRSWMADFQKRHLGLTASLAEGIDTDPFASKWLCC